MTKRTSTSIAGVKLDSFVFNAAGPRDVIEQEIEIIAKSSSSAVVMKSCTIGPRKGNEEPRYVDIPYGSINSMGLPNLGYKSYLEISSRLKKKFSKPIVASVAGLCEEDYTVMVEAFQKSYVDLIEVNLSCPNIKGKPQVAYDFEQSEKIIRNVSSIKGKKPLGLKLPPYYDFIHHQQMAEIIKIYPIKFVTLINSIGNALFIDADKEAVVIKPKNGFGGLGGHYIKPVALANVRKFYELLPQIDIIGCGGIYSGKDAFEYLLAGASAIQLGTVFMQEGPKCFGRIDSELDKIMEKKEYKSINEVKGRLRSL